MAKTYLTPDELVQGNKWLKTVFFPCIRNNTTDYVDPWYANTVVRACNTVYKFIVERLWDTNDSLRNELENLASTPYLNLPGDTNNIYRLKIATICKIFANMCARKEIFWDEKDHTQFELDYFKKTPFGAALWDFECFVSQIPTPAVTPTVKSTNSTPKAPRQTSTGAGHTLYRSNAGGIIGTSKEILTGNYVFCIEGKFTNPGKTKPRIHVSPQGKGSPLKVKYNSGQGHNDCILYFADLAAADNFKMLCDQHLPSNVIDLAVKKAATDPNGYVQVDTEFGIAYIKASKLHEEVSEEIESIEVACEDNISAEQLPESYYREEYQKAAQALIELLY